MHRILAFFALTEIKTKITSLLVFLLTMAYFLMRGWPVKPLATALFFAAMISLDLAVSALNHYMDSKVDGSRLPLSRPLALALILGLLILSAALGLALLVLTDPLILIPGGLAFLVGIAYSAGPLPLSRTALGELLSGLFYGFLIPALLFYINLAPESFIAWQRQGVHMSLTLHLPNLLALFLFSIAPVTATSAIMLANNICDLEADRLTGRRTLPHWLGIKRSLWLFALLAYLPLASLILMVLLGQLSPLALLALILLLPATFWVKSFWSRQDKRDTFPLSLKLYLLNIGGLTGVYLTQYFLN
ncbi:MAG: prenyltransferase [Clostridiaceae bacterium]|nr:prenyltransferase [Clostridiaceae bacterium]